MTIPKPYRRCVRELFIIAVVTMLLILTVLVAGFIPAHRAAGLDPLVALRVE